MNAKQFLSWESAVDWLVEQPDQQSLVRACYYDRPPAAAAHRYWLSTEWQAIRELIGERKGRVLDVGAGAGIASYALAKDGWSVTALEPDPSAKVGAQAIRALAGGAGLNIEVVEEFGESLPFADASFHLVHARQVLHHARDLPRFCKELARVLKPGGMLITTRDHVISNRRQLEIFLNEHPLHNLYGGENAYRLGEYRSALKGAGLSILKMLGPFDSAINYDPRSPNDLRQEARARLARVPGAAYLLRLLETDVALMSALKLFNRIHPNPGRSYSFVAIRPEAAR